MKDILITSLETITAFDVVTGAYKFTLDELQSASIEQSEEKTELTGKKGRKLSSMKRNKAVTISGNNGIVSGGLLELQTGCEFENKATRVMWTDYITITSENISAIKTTYKAVGTSGAEIAGLYVRNSDGTLGAAYEQKASAAKAGEFSLGGDDGKTLFFYENDGTIADPAIKAGTELVVYYQRNITADVLANKSDKYSGKCRLYIDALGEDKCANVYHIQFFIPKADFNGNFTFEMGDNQTIQAFEAEALSGACGAADSFWTFTVFGEKIGDTAVAGGTVVDPDNGSEG